MAVDGTDSRTMLGADQAEAMSFPVTLFLSDVALRQVVSW